MQRNPFVYADCDAKGLPYPDIEVSLREHYGQLAEDIIVEGLLSAWARRTGTSLSECRYLEIGANHPNATSATQLLQVSHAMSGVLVEANDALLDTLRTGRPSDIIVHAAVTDTDETEVEFFVSNQSELSSLDRRFVEEWRDGAVGLAAVKKVPALRINALLEQYFPERAPVLLAVDVEGMDLQIIQDVNWARWRPVIVQMEPSDHFEPTTSEDMIAFMSSLGYKLIAQTGVNLIFQDSDTNPQLSNTLTTAPASTASPSDMSNIASGSQDRPFAYLPTPSVGIVTRTKDRAVLLRRALESVKFQTYQNWKLVIVNDGGEPGPVDDLVAHVFQGDERVSIIHNPKSTGMEAASNAGLKSLSTDLAIIHDDDDSWAPEMLSVATQILVAQQSQFPQIRGVVTLINHVKETVTGNHVQVNSIKPWAAGAAHLEEGFIDLATLYNHNLFAPIAFLFDLNICKSLGLYDEALQVLGDWDFHQRYCSKYDIWIHPEYLAFYHHRAASTGALSNSGGNRHIYYRQLLKNKWLRESLADQGPSGAAAVLFREMAEKDIAGYHAPSFGGPPPRKSKYKSPLRAALSDWNRKRKAKRKA